MIENEAAYESAIRRNIRANARKTFLKREGAAEVMNFIYSKRGNFFESLADSLSTYGKLTDKQFEAVKRCMAQDAERKAEWEVKRQAQAALSNPVGGVGDKIRLEGVKVEKILTVSAMRFSYYDRDSQEIFLLRDAEGNRLVYKTKKEQFYQGQDELVQEGDVLTLKAKVKAHTEFRGEQQTQLGYVKFEKAAA